MFLSDKYVPVDLLGVSIQLTLQGYLTGSKLRNLYPALFAELFFDYLLTNLFLVYMDKRFFSMREMCIRSFTC